MISVLAHRGASLVCRENTVEAFLEAVREGADGVELDVRRAVDGTLVVHHDAALPDGRLVANLLAGELPAFVPTLRAALAACGAVLVNIEIKNAPIEPGWDVTEAIAADVAAEVAAAGRPAGALVSSFTLTTIDAVREADPTVRTGWLTLAGFDQHQAVETAAERGHAAIHPHERAITATVVRAAHDAALDVVAWTVDDPERMRALADMGVDVVITNRPDLAVAVLAPWRG